MAMVRRQIKRRSSIVVVARKQARLGQSSSYMARETTLLHGTVVDRRQTDEGKRISYHTSLGSIPRRGRRRAHVTRFQLEQAAYPLPYRSLQAVVLRSIIKAR